MKFNKTVNKKVVAPSNVVGSANANLLTKINKPSARQAPVSTADASYVAPKKDTLNTQGKKAYSKDCFTNLLTLLNTLKLDGDQYYRTENAQFQAVKSAVQTCAAEDAYFTAQCIRWSRTNGEGLRSVNQLASVFLAEHISGLSFAKYVYSKYNKGTKTGGVVFRLDDACQIKNAFFLCGGKSLPNAMLKGLRSALESADAYELAKYKSSGVLDLCNLVRPNPSNSKAITEVKTVDYLAALKSASKATKNTQKKAQYDAKVKSASKGDIQKIKTLDAIVLGLTVLADTHETRNTQAGEIVAKAVKAGKITADQGKVLNAEAQSENFKELLDGDKLGVLATVRNLVRMVENGVDAKTEKMVVDLLTNVDAIRKSLVHPMQLDLAYEMLLVTKTSNTMLVRTFCNALQRGFELALGNFTLGGKTCVMVDVGGSMNNPILKEGLKDKYQTTAKDKAFLVAATIAKVTNADILVFSTSAKFVTYDSSLGVFSLQQDLSRHFGGGGTSISSAFDLITNQKNVYDRIILLSDNEANNGNTAKSAQRYINDVAKPIIYAVDLAAYGTTQLKGDNVHELFGYGFSMFQDMQNREFNANAHFDEVRKVRFFNTEI